MDYINHIIAEALKVLALSVKVLGYGFWWLALGLTAGVRQLMRWQENRSIQSRGPTFDGGQGTGLVCPACGTINEVGERNCFACGSTL
jgi:hypothetical protein